MKPLFVNQLEPNQTITDCFLVQSKEVREKKTGEPYLSLLLSDKSGRIDAKMWDNVVEVLDAFDRDDFVKVKGLVQLHQNRPQITIHKIRKVEDREVDFGDYFPCSTRDAEEMWRELMAIAAAVKNTHIRTLLQSFLEDEEIAARYKRAPAAKSIHHAYLGGLLEHVLSLCNLSRAVASQYPQIDLDLLIAGAVLHDVGKIYELTFDRGFGYSSDGQLLGHIPMAFRMIGDKTCKLPGFPDGIRTLIEHIVLSHHGHLEFGSPKVPLFAEAMLFHYLDDLDSKMECMRAMVENDKQSTGNFTPYSHSLERAVLKKERFLETSAPGETSAGLDIPAAPRPVAVTPRPVAVAPPPVTGSLFGSKLLSALSDK
jgi:3'-5' exoribonuclease